MEPIIVVSGLPRSGTSMMMKMLEAGGLSIMTDNFRQADLDNPNGYYELERVKELNQGHRDWLAQAGGKVIKVISMLLVDLPPIYQYRVIFMRRRLKEVLASQKQMLIHRGEATNAVDDEQLIRLYTGHLKQVESWLAAQPQMEVLYLSYNHLLQAPFPFARQVSQFLDQTLEITRMAGAVDPALYRQRE